MCVSSVIRVAAGFSPDGKVRGTSHVLFSSVTAPCCSRISVEGRGNGPKAPRKPASCPIATIVTTNGSPVTKPVCASGKGSCEGRGAWLHPLRSFICAHRCCSFQAQRREVAGAEGSGRRTGGGCKRPFALDVSPCKQVPATVKLTIQTAAGDISKTILIDGHSLSAQQQQDDACLGDRRDPRPHPGTYVALPRASTSSRRRKPATTSPRRPAFRWQRRPKCSMKARGKGIGHIIAMMPG